MNGSICCGHCAQVMMIFVSPRLQFWITSVYSCLVTDRETAVGTRRSTGTTGRRRQVRTSGVKACSHHTKPIAKTENCVQETTLGLTYNEFVFDFVSMSRSMMFCLNCKKQDSPAWTQEAYRPRRIKYSICCPVLGGGGTPSLPGGIPPWVPPIPTGGYPPSWPGLGGYPIPAGEYPTLGTPHPDLARGNPIPAGGEGTPYWVPPSWAGRGVPHLWYLHPDLAQGGTPSLPGGYPTLGTPILTWPPPCPVRPGQGTPPPPPPIRPGQCTPHQTWLGYLPPVRPGWGTPPPHLDLAGVPAPPRCGQADRHVPRHNLPVILRTRSVITIFWGIFLQRKKIIVYACNLLRYDLMHKNVNIFLFCGNFTIILSKFKAPILWQLTVCKLYIEFVSEFSERRKTLPQPQIKSGDTLVYWVWRKQRRRIWNEWALSER